jgi:hypothetical protein
MPGTSNYIQVLVSTSLASTQELITLQRSSIQEEQAKETHDNAKQQAKQRTEPVAPGAPEFAIFAAQSNDTRPELRSVGQYAPPMRTSTSLAPLRGHGNGQRGARVRLQR